MAALNEMSTGMHPLNYAARLSKQATDVMFALAVNNRASAESWLDEVEKTVMALRESIEFKAAQ